MTVLEKKIFEEVNRYKSINKYVMEQGAGAPPPPTGTSATNETPPPPPPPTGADAGGPPPSNDSAASLPPPAEPESEEVDITDLVNTQKEIQSKVEQEATKNQDTVHKMDAIFSKLDDLATQLSQMDQVISKIDELENKVAEIRPMTAEEKLNLRSYDSYPFNQKLSDFFKEKEPEMKMTRKNTYVLTQDDANGYSKEDINKSFEDF